MLDIILEKTAEYLAVPSVVGHEKYFMDYLYRDFKAIGLHAYKNNGLLEISGEEPRSDIICAHLDRHGLICLGDSEFVYAAQFIKEIKYGENNQSSRKQVESIAKRFEGEKVYAYYPETAENLGEGVIEACYPHMRNSDALFFVSGIGYLEQNIPLAYARQARMEGNYFKGQLDNVISLAVVYALFKAGYQGTALLTCEEEIGKSWIHLANYLDGMDIETNELYVLDTSPYTIDAVIDQGPVIFRNRDKSEIFNKAMVARLKSRCEKLGLPYRIKDEDLMRSGKEIEDLGSTELGRLIQETKGKWSGATVQIPTLMYHTSNETTTMQAIENYFTFLKDALIDNVEEVHGKN